MIPLSTEGDNYVLPTGPLQLHFFGRIHNRPKPAVRTFEGHLPTSSFFFCSESLLPSVGRHSTMNLASLLGFGPPRYFRCASSALPCLHARRAAQKRPKIGIVRVHVYCSGGSAAVPVSAAHYYVVLVSVISCLTSYKTRQTLLV